MFEDNKWSSTENKKTKREKYKNSVKYKGVVDERCQTERKTQEIFIHVNDI